MKTNNYAEKIRRRKLRLKQIEAELSSVSRRKQKYWLWFWIPVAFALLASVIFLTLGYTGQLSREWSNYENLMLPAAFFSAILLILILWFFPKIYIRSLQTKSPDKGQSEFDREKEKLKLEDDTRKTLAQIIGGAVFLFGLIFTYNTYVLNREGQITDRFTKAIEQLRSENIAVRLGGLYALERIAKDSPKDQGTIMDILSAYVREKSPLKKPAKTETQNREAGTEPQEEQINENEKVKTDVQAALTVIGRRAIKQDNGSKIDLREANLAGVFLEEAWLQFADLTKTNLGNADLRGAHLNYADLTYANLADAYLVDADLRGVKLQEVKLDNATLENADLTYADFSYAESGRRNNTMVTSAGSVSILPEKATLHAASSNFEHVRLGKATLVFANLSGVSFKMTDLRGANLENANLTYANFEETLFQDAILTLADFRFADLSKIRENLTYEQMATAIINKETKLPGYLELRREELLKISAKNFEKRKKERINSQ